MLQEYVKAEKKKKIKTYCPTRWIEKQDSLRDFLQLFHGIYDALETIKASSDRNSSPNDLAYQAAMSRPEFFIPLHIAVFVMNLLFRFPIACHGNTNLSSAIETVDTVVKALKSLRENTQQEFQAIYKECEEMADILGVALSPQRIVGRQNYRKKGSTDSAENYYLEASFIPFIDHFIDEIVTRFCGQKADAFMLQGLIPSWLNDFSDEAILKVAAIYANDLDCATESELKGELLLWRTTWDLIEVIYFATTLNYNN